MARIMSILADHLSTLSSGLFLAHLAGYSTPCTTP